MAAGGTHAALCEEVARIGGGAVPPPSERQANLCLHDAKGSVVAAARSYCSAMRFRHDMQTQSLKINDVDAIVRQSIVHLLADTSTPEQRPARDRAGRLVVVYYGRNIHPANVAPLDILRLVSYQQELMETQTGGEHPEEIVHIADLKGWTLANFSPQLEKLAMDTMHLRYPGHAGTSYVLNPPWYFKVAWNIFKNFVSQELLDKTVMIGNDVTKLHQYIDPSNLPPEYGGTLHFNLDEWIAARYVAEGVAPGTPSTHQPLPSILSELASLGLSAADVTIAALKSGVLQKRGAGGMWGTTSWKKRYFVVTGSQLIYFESDKGSKAHRAWELRGATVEETLEDKKNGFAIGLPAGRRLELAAESDQDRAAWLELITSVASS